MTTLRPTAQEGAPLTTAATVLPRPPYEEGAETAMRSTLATQYQTVKPLLALPGR